MANTIAEHIDVDLHMEKRNYDATQTYWVGKRRHVHPAGVKLEITLSQSDYERIFETKYMNVGKGGALEYIPVDEATEFIKNTVNGNISKDELDTQRTKERNSEDMMTSQTIIYHIESI